MSANADSRILIVEDNVVSQKLIVQFLRLEGFGAIDMATDGVEGLKKLDEQDYDIVFFDLLMPNMDGLEFLQQAKTNTEQKAAFILCSAELEDEKLLDIIEAGAVSYLTKPITHDKVKKSIFQYYKWLSKQSYSK